MNAKEYMEIWENARKDIDTNPSIDLESILSSADEMPDYLGGKTIGDIAREIFEALRDAEPVENEWTERLCEKLLNYRYIDKLCDFRRGRPIKWVKKEDGKIMAGIFMRIFITQQNVVYIDCKTVFNSFINLDFEKYLFFHKLSDDEQMILLANEYLKEGNSSDFENEDEDEDGKISK